MKVFENIIVLEDYNYVEGILELKISGNRFLETNIKEQFTVDNILSAKFNIEKKYLAPNIPKGIKKDKTFVIDIPFKIPSYVKNDSNDIAFNAQYDKIICDDEYVTDDGFLKVKRYDTVKDGDVIFSTVKLKAYGLKKHRREELEYITKHELFSAVEGKGKLKITPNKDYYDIGEKVLIEAISTGGEFLGWENDFQNLSQTRIEITVEKDYQFKALFETPKSSIATTVSDTSETIKEIARRKFSWQHNPSGNKSDSNYVKPDLEYSSGCFGSIFEIIAGLFVAIGYLFYAVIFLTIVISIIKVFGWWSFLFVGLILLWWLFPKISRFFKWINWQWIFSSILGLILISGLIGFFVNLEKLPSYTPRPVSVPETTEVIKENTSIDYSHNLYWKDYDGRVFTTTVVVNSDDVAHEKNVKNSITNINTESNYNRLLSIVHYESDESLLRVYDALDNVRSSNNLSNLNFLNAIVSMVQHIPYFAIMPETCNPLSYSNESVRQLLATNPCQGNIRFGLKTPAEFLKDLKGDCDSRTLLLYRILKHYKYDVAILGSNTYSHSILGVNINQDIPNGVYKYKNGKRYYVWETTSKDFKLGQLPKPISNMNFWNFNLN